MTEKKILFLASWENAVSDVCYYDRKNDDELSCKDVDNLLNNGEVTLREILDSIKKVLLENYPKMHHYIGKENETS